MSPKKKTEANELMIVNDIPGEECRIAVIADGHLEELYTERTSTATNVGNIYKGRVMNVEPAIQAAFVDFGEGQNGFLHISDLHPKYFPDGDRVERVGKKIPRRERPPIQDALRRGDEVLVQVLKEGIGTKGPTLTSYLSIPGRLLVMMPDMDRVGVSRKEEDLQRRREMRDLLDSLGLPEGFGFIVRTAGVGSPKTELKRDAAYLTRLWKVMEKRLKKVGAPCELYRESDVLIRTVRDVMRPSIRAIIVDSESAFLRVETFLNVVSPRSAPKVVLYRRRTPIFHAYDIERQIELIHSREVPLPSGGRLIIDQTEALVAIDVNSGRSRSATDSETNAFETNLEAADEICRQLRLRDLGGLVVNDLIDMHSRRHRQQVEDRFDLNLKRDRARTTMARISEFGLLEMTRQRMRPSLRKAHFVPCPHCGGHGEIRSSEFVASDAARRVAFLLEVPRIDRVEIVCSPRVASVLLSTKRRELVRLEDVTGKKIDVRVSDAIATDRIDYYAYDERNADIDITQLSRQKPPTVADLEAEAERLSAGEVSESAPSSDTRRRSRRRRPEPANAAEMALAGGFDDLIDDDSFSDDDDGSDDDQQDQTEASHDPQAAEPAEGGRRKRRRRGRGRRSRMNQQGDASLAPDAQSAQPHPAEDHVDESNGHAEPFGSHENGTMPSTADLPFVSDVPPSSDQMWEVPASEHNLEEPTVFVPQDPGANQNDQVETLPATSGQSSAGDQHATAPENQSDAQGRKRRRRRGRGRGRRTDGATPSTHAGQQPAQRDEAQSSNRMRPDDRRGREPRRDDREHRRGGRGRRGRGGRDANRDTQSRDVNGERGRSAQSFDANRRPASSSQPAPSLPVGSVAEAKPRRTLYGRYGRASAIAKTSTKSTDE
ncbi:MAG TPA: Rne/Rng family ribonuclease [Phycisphaerales bacterium]|nr:Rne/Rng family ribonuclease [Phycisphaerales bacterium]